MTEWEWLVEARPLDMLRHVRGWASNRKLLLFCCACGFEADKAEPPSDGPNTTFLGVMEFADHPEDRSLIAPWVAGVAGLVGPESVPLPDRPSVWAGRWANEWFNPPYVSEKCMASLLREILGNPFRAVPLDPAWLTPEVRSVAEAAYDARVMNTNELDATHLAILADALEEAGAAEALPRHLRMWVLCAACGGMGENWGYFPPAMVPCLDCGGAGWLKCEEPHARGCWVVDLVLGKR